MKLSTQIIKKLMTPVLIEDKSFNQFKTKEETWDELTQGIIKYSTDSKTIYKSIYGLNLENPEAIINHIPDLYKSFIEEIAEQYIKEINTDASEYFLKNKVEEFSNELNYFHELQNAIISVERKNLKNEIPLNAKMYDFDVSDNEFEQLVKKNARKDLKNKMNQWDEEIEIQKPAFSKEDIQDDEKLKNTVEHNKDLKAKDKKKHIKTYSWFMYSIAACLVIVFGLYFFNNLLINKITTNNNIVNDQVEIITKDSIDALISSINKKSEVIQITSPSGFSYIDNNNIKSVKVEIYDFSKQKATLEETFKKATKLKTYYQNKLDSLTRIEGKYTFYENTITIYSGIAAPRKLINYNSLLYLSTDNNFFKIIKTETPINLEEENEEQKIEQLEKILFNE